MTKPKSKPLEPKDYERLGREIESLLVTDYIQVLHSTPRQIWSSLLRGMAGGLGGILGATVGVALLLFLLQILGSHLPLVGPWIQHLTQTIKSATRVK